MSLTWMTGCGENACAFTAVAGGCCAIDSLLGAPAVTVMLDDVTPVRFDAANNNERLPIVPVRDRLTNVAAPLAFVVAVSVPPSAGRPAESETVTTTPAWLTA